MDRNCLGVIDIEEGVEFSMRNDTSQNGHWIPLRLSYHSSSPGDILSTTNIRGYSIPTFRTNRAVVEQQVSVCGDTLHTNGVQFRWMGSTDMGTDVSRVSRDMWALANVTAILVRTNETREVLLEERFGGNTLK